MSPNVSESIFSDHEKRPAVIARPERVGLEESDASLDIDKVKIETLNTRCSISLLKCTSRSCVTDGCLSGRQPFPLLLLLQESAFPLPGETGGDSVPRIQAEGGCRDYRRSREWMMTKQHKQGHF